MRRAPTPTLERCAACGLDVARWRVRRGGLGLLPRFLQTHGGAGRGRGAGAIVMRGVKGWGRGDANVTRQHPEKWQGERNGQAKLTRRDVRAIRRAYARAGVSQAALAEQYGVSQSAVGMVIRRVNWGHVE
jgi:hypothetical protein